MAESTVVSASLRYAASPMPPTRRGVVSPAVAPSLGAGEIDADGLAVGAGVAVPEAGADVAADAEGPDGPFGAAPGMCAACAICSNCCAALSSSLTVGS